MDTREPQASGKVARAITLLTHLIAGTAALAGIASGMVMVPLLATVVYDNQRTSPAPGDENLVYTAISALLAAVALGVISGNLVLQRAHLRYEEVRDMDRELVELVQQVRDSPEYGQCWGPRVSPDDVPEDLFHYTSRIISYWAKSWRHGRLRENLARTYAREFFKSEVPRLYWERYGSWHKPRRGIRKLVSILDEEYLRAIKSGPPVRAYEPPARALNGGDATGHPDPLGLRRVVWRENVPRRVRSHRLQVYESVNSPAFKDQMNPRKASSDTTNTVRGS